MKRQLEDWQAWGKHRKRLLFFYQDKVLDLTDFAAIHPGGKKALNNYVYRDITKTLFTIYPHTAKVLDRLEGYNIGVNSSFKRGTVKQTGGREEKASRIGSKQKRRVCFRKTVNYSEQKKQNWAVTMKGKEGVEVKYITQDMKTTKQCKKKETKKLQVSIKLIGDGSLSDISMLPSSSDKYDEAEWNECTTNSEEINEEKTVITIPKLRIKTMDKIQSDCR